MKRLLRFAAAGPAAVFPVVGQGCREQVEDLGLASAIELVDSPRHAAVLLVCGDIPPDCIDALCRVHDQLPHPRTTLWWHAKPIEAAQEGRVIEDDPVFEIRDAWSEVLRSDRESERHWLPDEPPNKWRGEGEHGQGGEGMMGGCPFGRPMAMTDDDLRDGLALDALTFQLGPFAPMLPPGLVLKLTLQGDVVQAVDMIRAAFPDLQKSMNRQQPSLSPGERDRGRGVSKKGEAAPGRALRQLARLARLRELHWLSRGLFAAAHRLQQGGTVDQSALAGLVRRSRLLHSVASGLGRLDDGSDARDRIAGWVESLDSGQATIDGGQSPLDPGTLVGLEWDQLITVVNSVEPHALQPPAKEAA